MCNQSFTFKHFKSRGMAQKCGQNAVWIKLLRYVALSLKGKGLALTGPIADYHKAC